MAAVPESPLRDALDRILAEHRTPAEQAAALEALRSTLPHSIRPCTLEGFCELPANETPEYDCFTFAVDLIDCPGRIAARKFAPKKWGGIQRPGIADALPGPAFLESLLLPEPTSFQSCQDYDLVIYYDDFGIAKHAGKIVRGAIVSKWGMKGALWQHGVWEVPHSYGTVVKFKYFSHHPREYVRQQWRLYLHQLAQSVKGFSDLFG